jgi:drug/metabolite transporter (DMT)-like permease
MQYSFAFASALLYGVCYIIYAWATERASFAYMMFVGSAMTVVVTAPFALRETVDAKVTAAILLERSLWLIASLCLYLSIKRIGVSVTSIFESTYPLFVVLFSAWLARTRPPLYVALGALLVVGGVAVIGYGRSKGAT